MHEVGVHMLYQYFRSHHVNIAACVAVLGRRHRVVSMKGRRVGGPWTGTKEPEQHETIAAASIWGLLRTIAASAWRNG